MSTNIICQQKAVAVEIFIGTDSVSPENKEIEFYFISQGTTWIGSGNPTDIYWITNDPGILSLEYLPSVNNNITSSWKGWDFILSNDYPTYGQYGCGLYKFSTDESGAYFYLDYRDKRYGAYTNCNGQCADIWIKYDDSNNSFSYKNKAVESNWTGITNGQLLKIWDMKKQGDPNTSYFPNFWQNCLVLTQNVNKPRIVWGPHPSFSATNYKVYRAVSTLPLSNPELFASLIATVSSSTFDYTDYEYDMIGDDYYLYYFIKAYNSGSNSYSSRTNIVNTKGGIFKHAQNNVDIKNTYNFYLAPNYPNPFNPSTSITYQLPKKGHVTLKVYNALGKEVAELVNEIKEEGTYSCKFNGDNLPSGMYFYKIQSNEFVDVKKMLLLK